MMHLEPNRRSKKLGPMLKKVLKLEHSDLSRKFFMTALLKWEEGKPISRKEWLQLMIKYEATSVEGTNEQDREK